MKYENELRNFVEDINCVRDNIRCKQCAFYVNGETCLLNRLHENLNKIDDLEME